MALSRRSIRSVACSSGIVERAYYWEMGTK
jgi:hypothetical protein